MLPMPPGAALPPPPIPMGPPMGPPPGAIPMPPPGLMPPGMMPPMDPMMGMPPPPPPMPAPPPPAMPPAIPDIAGQGEANPLIGLFESMTRRVGPKRPRNWVAPPKPTKTGIIDFSTRQESLFSQLRRRFDDDERWFKGDVVGTFRSFDEDEDEQLPSSAMTDEVNLVANIGAGIDLNFQILYTDPARVEDTQRCEDFLYRAREEAEKRHTRAGGGDLPRDEWLDATRRGRVVSRILPDLDDEDWPFRETLLEPGNVFPEWDNGDIRRLVHVYSDTVSGIITAFDDEDGTVRKKLYGGEEGEKASSGSSMSHTKRKGSDRVRVVEYWDTEYRALLVDGMEIIPVTEHEYGFVPFVYQIAPLGVPAHARRSTRTDAGTDSWTDGQHLADSGVALFHYRKPIHAKQEAFMSLLFNIFEKNASDPSWIITGDEAGQKVSGARTIENKRGTVNYIIKDHEQIEPMIPQVDGGLAQPIMQSFTRDFQTGALPLTSYGSSQDGQISGNAIEGLNESGRDKLTPYLRMFQTYHARKAWMYLTLWRDWGNLAMPDDMGFPTGTITVPFRRRSPSNAAPAFDLDVEMVDRAGTNVQCRMTSIRMQNLAGLGNAASVWMQGGMMSKREAMELRGVRDPDAVFEEIAYETARATEEYQTGEMLVEIIKRNRGLEDGDPELTKIAAEIFTTIYGRKVEAMLAPPAPPSAPAGPGPGEMGGAPMGMGGPPPGMGGMAGPPQPDVNTSGMNLAAMGMGPGSQGGIVGRPPGM